MHRWVGEVGPDETAYGDAFHAADETDADRRTQNLRAVELLLGHTKIESAARYLGIDVDDALELAEQTEV